MDDFANMLKLLKHICRASVSKIARLMENVFDLIRERKLKVIAPVTVYDYSDLGQVFRLMSDGRNSGEIVLKLTSKSVVNAALQKRSSFTLDLKGSYVLVGGLGGLGRAMALYLAEHGAKHMALISRSGATKSESREVLQELHSKNVNAIAYACDVADSENLKFTIEKINQDMPAIKGVIQAAMVLKDSLFENMDYESWAAATRPKIQGSWNLHSVMPKDLDFFIMLSSVTAIIGNPGQASYSAGNTFQDALAHYRKASNLSAVSINLGAIRDIGWVAENKDYPVIKGLDQMIVDEKAFYSVLNSAISGYSDGKHKIPTQLIMAAGTGVSDHSILSLPVTEICQAECLAIQQKNPSHNLWWFDEVKFAFLRKIDMYGKKETTEDSQKDLRALLIQVKSTKGACEVVQSAIVQKLAKLTMIPEADIDVSRPVHHYGVDSLVAIDYRNWIFRELKSTVTVFDILNSVPLTQLAAKIARNSELVPENYKEEE